MKPILFNTEMVKAILAGRKTVTRRLIKPHNSRKAKHCNYSQGEGLWFDNEVNEWDKDTHIKDYSISSCWIGTTIYIQKFAPYRPGDVLYVRETFLKAGGYYHYKADGKHEILDTLVGHSFFKWRPSIHMPKEAARIFLLVTDVRVERLQDITDEQVIAEGINIPKTASCEERCLLAFARYLKLWNNTIKKADIDKYGWEASPWVWVIEFERISKEEALKNDK